MLRRKASGLLAVLFATAVISGTSFAADVTGTQTRDSGGSDISSPQEVAESVEEAPAEVVSVEEAAAEASAEEAAVEEVPAEEAVAEEAAPAAEAPAEEAAVEEVQAEEAVAEEAAPAAEAPAEEAAVEEVPAEEAVAGEAAPAEKAAAVEAPATVQTAPVQETTLTITHHFSYGDIDVSETQTVDGLRAGDTANAADYSYKEDYNKCLNSDAAVTLASGENALTIEYTLADGYEIVG